MTRRMSSPEIVEALKVDVLSAFRSGCVIQMDYVGVEAEFVENDPDLVAFHPMRSCGMCAAGARLLAGGTFEQDASDDGSYTAYLARSLGRSVYYANGFLCGSSYEPLGLGYSIRMAERDKHFPLTPDEREEFVLGYEDGAVVCAWVVEQKQSGGLLATEAT